MPKTSEKYIEPALVKFVQNLGGDCIKYVSVYSVGYPDRICLFDNEIVCFVETKSAGRQMSPMQLLRKRQLEKRGFTVFKFDSIDQFYLLRDWLMLRNKETKKQ